MTSVCGHSPICSGYPKYDHFRHTALAVNTGAPPPTVQTFCLEETANQKKLGLKGAQSQRESSLNSLFHIVDRLSGSKKPSPH